MKKNYFETLIGITIVIFSICCVLFTMKITNKKLTHEFYNLYATFDNIEGINIGTKIKIGGVEIGEVDKIIIGTNYEIIVKLKIKKDIEIPIDSNIKIATSGIIGGKYLKVEIGGDENTLQNDDNFEFTESTMDLEDMITKFMLNKTSKKNEK